MGEGVFALSDLPPALRPAPVTVTRPGASSVKQNKPIAM